MPDNPLPPAETTNPVPHVHHYVLKGSGGSHYAECDVDVSHGWLDDWQPLYKLCGHKLAGDNGPIVGSRSKVEAAIQEAMG